MKKDKQKKIIIEITGWLGASCLLLAYFLIVTERIKHTNFYYIFLNIIGALLLTINTYYHKAYPSVVTNLVWFIIGTFIYLIQIL